ncbi:MAG: hypothetical protein Q9201_000727 [Fulgogasparrea decipioides]
MATFLPRPQSPEQPFLFTSASPPDQYQTDVTQRRRSLRDPSAPMAQQPAVDHRANGGPGYGNTNGSMPAPEGQHAPTPNREAPHRSRMLMGAMPFKAARSPPNAKNTSHVPCKFFRLGQCQAGKACPFSHSTDVSSVDTPCKYFAKGNCKFGAKCALAHILPNGRRVNRPNNLVGGLLNLGGRVDPQTYHPDSALANSLLAQQTISDPAAFAPPYPHLSESEYQLQSPLPTNYYESNVPAENGYTTHPEPQYGSPRDDGRLALPSVGHLSTLDAPMPASFDSQGISYIARHGPVAASVPSKFGLDSPLSSLPKKVGLPSSALRNLHNSAFGQDSRSNASNLGSSPLGSGDEGYSQRTMHSQPVGKPTVISASVPRARANDDWDDGMLFGGEEDFLPTSLHDLLTPQERMRRLSRTEQDERSFRESLSGMGTPADSSSQVGSPSHASPSRFSALFAKQRRDEQSNLTASASAFGHVGSPLRNSSLHLGRSPSLRATSNPTRSGEVSPYLASPPRQSSMSAISQQLARTRISSKTDAGFNDSGPANGLHPNSARTQNQTATSSTRLDRVSSSNNANNHRIDEELSEGVFSMEEEEETHKKRHSGSAWNYQQEAVPPQDRVPSPQLGPIGTGRAHRTSEVEKVSKEFWT